MSGHAAGKPARVTSAPDPGLAAEQGSSARALSPAATEIDDPEGQDIMDQIQREGIKIRDFAFSPPYTNSNPPSTTDAIPIASTSTTPLTLTSFPAPPRTTEVFDPYKGLIEVDYRWSQTNRLYPVTGKTLRRLLDLAWLTHDDLSARGHPLDLAALQAHDNHRAAAKEANGGLEAYPWRPLVAEGSQPPTTEERRIMLENCGGLWKQHDRMLASKKAREQWRRKEEEDAAEKKREFEEREREKERKRKRRGKRKMEEGDDIDYRKQKLEETNSACGPKRIRFSPSDDGEEVHSSQDTNTRPLLPPKKQYPAPLQAYNPKLYPDAASIIEASSQSQPRPSFPERSDTPPIGRADTPPSTDDGGGNAYHAQRLVHPKKNGRGLGRTQTFAELYVCFLFLSIFHTDKSSLSQFLEHIIIDGVISLSFTSSCTCNCFYTLYQHCIYTGSPSICISIFLCSTMHFYRPNKRSVFPFSFFKAVRTIRRDWENRRYLREGISSRLIFGQI